MKKLAFAIAILLSGANAMALTQSGVSAKLNKFHFAANSALDRKDISYGDVSINLVEKSIKLTLQPAMKCPAGALCAMVMPAPIEVELPLVKAEVGSCHELVYTARKNLMPVDGPLNEIIVIDNSTNYCEVILPAMTEVQYTVETPRPFLREVHVMYGEKLN
ncbi:MAG: hypothetical protein AB7F86_04540 [Bdellovibrionales bacterium]